MQKMKFNLEAQLLEKYKCSPFFLKFLLWSTRPSLFNNSATLHDTTNQVFHEVIVWVEYGVV